MIDVVAVQDFCWRLDIGLLALDGHQLAADRESSGGGVCLQLLMGLIKADDGGLARIVAMATR